MSNFKIKFIMIPSFISGYDGELYENIRMGILWQKYLSETLKIRYDISMTNIRYDKNHNLWEADCISIKDFSTTWLEKGALIELVGTYNIIAIGKII